MLETIFIEAEQLKSVKLTDTKQITAVWFDTIDKKITWRGEIQKIYLDKKGEAYGYDVYVY
jgi:hypothetical protein